MATVPPQFQDGASHDRERDSRKQNFQQTNGLGDLGMRATCEPIRGFVTCRISSSFERTPQVGSLGAR